MGRQPEEDDDDWDMPGDDVLRELSPLLDTRQPGLFQRIERRRAAYFADVENGQDDEDLENEDGDERGVGKPGGQQRCADAACAPPSGFADLSTWCCVAFQPAGSHLAPSEKRPAWLISMMDQPTLVLSLVTSTPMQIADMPTLPLLPAVGIARGGFAPGRLFWLTGAKAREIRIRFYRCLLQLWSRCMHSAARLRGVRRPALNGHEMLMERLRAREQRSAVPPTPLVPSNPRPARQFRLPADSLFS